MVMLNTPMPVQPHYADTYSLDGADCPTCCELASEAWERMTWGGMNGINADMTIEYWRAITGRSIAYAEFLHGNR